MKNKITMILVALLMVVTLSACEQKKKVEEVNVNDFIKIEVDGHNEEGKVEKINLSSNDVVNKYIKDNELDFTIDDVLDGKLNDKKSKEVQNVINLHSFANAIKFNPETKTDNLKNGDVVKYTLSVDEKIAEETGFKLANKEFVYTVAGLKEIEEVDIMKYIHVGTVGKKPIAKVVVNTDEIPAEYEGLYEVTHEVKIKEGQAINDGDKVIVKVINKSDGKNGKVAKEEEKEFEITIEDKGSYPTTLTTEQSNKIVDLSIKNINEKISNGEFPFFLEGNYSVERTNIEVNPIKQYFAYNTVEPNKNFFGIVLRIDQTGTALEDISNDEIVGEYETGDVITVSQYAYVSWENIALTADGNIDDSLMKMNYNKSTATTNTEEEQKSALLNKVSSGYTIQEID